MDCIGRDRGDVPARVMLPFPSLGPKPSSLQHQLQERLASICSVLGSPEVLQMGFLMHIRASSSDGPLLRTFALSGAKHGQGGGLIASEQWFLMVPCDDSIDLCDDPPPRLAGLRLAIAHKAFVEISGINEADADEVQDGWAGQPTVFSWMYTKSIIESNCDSNAGV